MTTPVSESNFLKVSYIFNKYSLKIFEQIFELAIPSLPGTFLDFLLQYRFSYVKLKAVKNFIVTETALISLTFIFIFPILQK